MVKAAADEDEDWEPEDDDLAEGLAGLDREPDGDADERVAADAAKDDVLSLGDVDLGVGKGEDVGVCFVRRRPDHPSHSTAP